MHFWSASALPPNGESTVQAFTKANILLLIKIFGAHHDYSLTKPKGKKFPRAFGAHGEIILIVDSKRRGGVRTDTPA